MKSTLVTKENYVQGKGIDGKEIIGLIPGITKQCYAVSPNKDAAYVKFNVDPRFNGCIPIVNLLCEFGTPYTQVRGFGVKPVVDGILEVEFYGVAFIPEHSFRISALLFR